MSNKQNHLPQIFADNRRSGIQPNARENTRIIFVSVDLEIHCGFSAACSRLIPYRSYFGPLFPFYLRRSA
jgi:hypothetical protein